jgi:hypothetical protein
MKHRLLQAAALGVGLIQLCGCAGSPSADTKYYSDGSPINPNERERRKEEFQRRKEECQRLYQLLGDRSLTTQQIEAIRVSMNSHFCAGLVP